MNVPPCCCPLNASMVPCRRPTATQAQPSVVFLTPSCRPLPSFRSLNAPVCCFCWFLAVAPNHLSAARRRLSAAQPPHKRSLAACFCTPLATPHLLFILQAQPRTGFLQPKHNRVPAFHRSTTAPCRVSAVFLQQNGVLFACFWRLFRVFCLPYFRQALKERTHRA